MCDIVMLVIVLLSRKVFNKKKSVDGVNSFQTCSTDDDILPLVGKT